KSSLRRQSTRPHGEYRCPPLIAAPEARKHRSGKGIGERGSAAGSIMVGSRFFRGLAEGWQRAPQRSLAALAAVGCLLAAAPAFADCQQVGSTVTCSGTDNDGFNAGAQNALTVNVLTGAAVNNLVLGGIAIQLNDNNVVTNNGAIAGGDGGAGIRAGSGNTITNAGTGTITDNHGPRSFILAT